MRKLKLRVFYNYVRSNNQQMAELGLEPRFARICSALCFFHSRNSSFSIYLFPIKKSSNVHRIRVGVGGRCCSYFVGPRAQSPEKPRSLVFRKGLQSPLGYHQMGAQGCPGSAEREQPVCKAQVRRPAGELVAYRVNLLKLEPCGCSPSTYTM